MRNERTESSKIFVIMIFIAGKLFEGRKFCIVVELTI